MRITGGIWRSRRLPTGKLRKVRPATDQQRESVFNMLGNLLDFEGVSVLDLFAGSGSFGLEALSRGAAFALFVEQDRGNVRVLKEILKQLQAAQRTRVIGMNVRRFVQLPRQQFAPTAFQVVFYDPPYHQSYGDVFPLLLRSGYVQPGSIFVVKRSARSSLDPPSYCAVYRSRKFGDTLIDLWLVEASEVFSDED